MRSAKALVLLAAALLLAAPVLAPTAAYGAPSELKGAKAPAFTGYTLSGQPFSLADYAGKVPVILTFWSIYCKSCVEEMASLQRLYEKYGPGKVAVVAVNEDADIGVERVKGFLERFAASPDGGKLTFPVFFDAKGEVFEKFRVLHLPTLVYIDRDGTVLEVIEGFEKGRELSVLLAIEKLVTSVSAEPLREVASEVIFDLDVTVPVCGQYRDGRWYRSLDLDEGRDDVLARTRARGEAYLRREAMRLALARMDVKLRFDDRVPSCGVPYGRELRTPAERGDTLDLLLSRLALSRVVETAGPGEDQEGEREVTLYRRLRVSLEALRSQLEQDSAFSLRRSVLRLRFVHASAVEERMVLDAIQYGYPYLSELSEVKAERGGGAEYILTSHASPERVVESLCSLSLGHRKCGAELLPGGVVEVSVWK